MHESSEQALARELQEELGEHAAIKQVLWVNESFFRESHLDHVFHEICFYYLVKLEKFQYLHWHPIDRLSETILKPPFLQDLVPQVHSTLLAGRIPAAKHFATWQ